MKRLIAVTLCTVLLAGCGIGKSKNENKNKLNNYIYGMWVTCYELENMAAGGFQENFIAMLDDAQNMGINSFFVHIRAFGDCIYPSDVFPLTEWCKNENYDVLGFMIEECHKRNLKFHAWINPYRISHDKNAQINSVLANLHEGEDVLRAENGVYLNPASNTVKSLIVMSVREIVTFYDVDGIHFDDYFYPTTEESFDSISYNAYLQSTASPIPLSDFRRTQINSMIFAVKQAVKSTRQEVLFSVSPAADITRNKEILYADVKLWCTSGNIDAVIPQLYFGFEYPIEQFKFNNLLNEWLDLVKDSDVQLLIGLAPYKLDTDAAHDSAEWENGTQIVANQISLLYGQKRVSGAVLFSYSALINKSENYIKQKENIAKAFKRK